MCMCGSPQEVCLPLPRRICLYSALKCVEMNIPIILIGSVRVCYVCQSRTCCLTIGGDVLGWAIPCVMCRSYRARWHVHVVGLTQTKLSSVPRARMLNISQYTHTHIPQMRLDGTPDGRRTDGRLRWQFQMRGPFSPPHGVGRCGDPPACRYRYENIRFPPFNTHTHASPMRLPTYTQTHRYASLAAASLRTAANTRDALVCEG